jgi:toxin ParE1/3/4
VVARRPELHPEALAEADAGVLWYLDRSPRVAERFIAAIDTALERICEAPERWPPYVAGTRRYVMLKFPYFIVYKVTPQAVYVYAIAHAKRRPDYWKERLAESQQG